jgi:hypothetical protein
MVSNISESTAYCASREETKHVIVVTVLAIIMSGYNEAI